MQRFQSNHVQASVCAPSNLGIVVHDIQLRRTKGICSPKPTLTRQFRPSVVTQHKAREQYRHRSRNFFNGIFRYRSGPHRGLPIVFLWTHLYVYRRFYKTYDTRINSQDPAYQNEHSHTLLNRTNTKVLDHSEYSTFYHRLMSDLSIDSWVSHVKVDYASDALIHH